MLDKDQEGLIFNIQNFSVHDGEGIRTLVFFKGCPLHCIWCCNPESQKFTPERAFNPMRCLTAAECGRCVKACEYGALTLIDGLICFNPQKCTACGKCVDRCPSGAQSFYGKKYTVEEVINIVEKDEAFYVRSGGGITLSGGEALCQPDFALALLRESKRHSLRTTIETCGHYPAEVLAEACKHLDELIMDIKSLNEEKHKKFTGVTNEQILKNVKYLCDNQPDLKITFRTPVIPGFNDTEEDIMAIRELLPVRDTLTYELMTYHRMGQPKYGYLGRPYQLEGVVADEVLMKKLRAMIAQYAETHKNA